MQVDRPLNQNPLPLFLKLPKELREHVCSFLPLGTALLLTEKPSPLSRWIIQLKAKEEHLLLCKLHRAVQKLGLFLPPDIQKKLSELPFSEKLERPLTSWEDVKQYAELWVDKLMKVFEPLPGFKEVVEDTKEDLITCLDPQAALPDLEKSYYGKIENDFPYYEPFYPSHEEKPFLLSWQPRVSTILRVLATDLLGTDSERYRLAMEGVFSGIYPEKDLEAIFEALLGLELVHDRPIQTLVTLARKMPLLREAGYILIIKFMHNRGERGPSFYQLIDELLEEDLSTTTKKRVILTLAQTQAAKAIEKIRTLLDKKAQEEIFLDLFNILPDFLLQGKEACKKLLTLMGPGEEEGKNKNIFTTLRMLALLLENEEEDSLFWLGIRGRNRETFSLPLAIHLILLYQFKWQSNLLEATQRVYAISSHFKQPKFLLGALYGMSLLSSYEETTTLQILKDFFKILTPEMVGPFIDIFFLPNRIFFPYLVDSDAIYIELDKGIQDKASRERIEEKIYSSIDNLRGAANEVPYDCVLAYMMKRFCTNGEKKEVAVTTLIRKTREAASLRNPTYGPSHAIGLCFLSLIQEARWFTRAGAKRKKELMASLHPNDLLFSVTHEYLSFEEALPYLLEGIDEEEKENRLYTFVKGSLLLRIKGKKGIAPFFKKYKAYITEEIKKRIFCNSFKAGQLLIKERIITSEQAIEWAKNKEIYRK